ncbi:MAG: Rha family transcriptional regulator [Methanomassiliicoccales archaeon]|jgi:Rha family phage regulatory protein
MNSLILPDDIYGVTEKSGVPVVSSRKIADVFRKPHDDVLKSVRSLIEGLGEISESEWQNNFILSRYKNSQNKYQPEYLLTKKGFTLLAVGFTGKKALKFKVQYIDRFEQMESFIRNLYEAKADFPEFTQAIMFTHEEPRHYHFSNELDMINHIVLGMTTRQFKEAHNLGKVSSIRPHLTPAQAEAVKTLQRIDIGLIHAIPDFHKRKRILTDQFQRKSVKVIA